MSDNNWGADEVAKRNAEAADIQCGIDKRAKAKQEAEAAEIQRAKDKWTKVKREAEAAEIRKGIDGHTPPKSGDPPVGGKFKKAISGNPRGRPPKKARSLTPRQLRRDILGIAEAQVTVKTDKGLVKVSVIEAIIMRAASKALNGHGPSIRFMMSLYADKVAEHSDVHDEKFKSLEELEKILAFNPKEDKTEFSRKNMNHMRKLTRRT